MVTKKQNMIYYNYLKHIEELIEIEKALMEKPRPEINPETGHFFDGPDKLNFRKVLKYQDYLDTMKEEAYKFEKYENEAVPYIKFKAEVDRKVDMIDKEIRDYLF